MNTEIRDQRSEIGKSGLTDERKAHLRGMAAAGVDDFKVSCQCNEMHGHFLTVEECEYLLTLPLGITLRKAVETKARRAFKEQIKGEPVDNETSGLLCAGNIAPLCGANYSTLRKALYLATNQYVIGSIRSELQDRFPWGLCK